MKKVLSLALIWCVMTPGLLRAATTIDPTSKFAWGANIGFTDWRPSTTDGVKIGTNFCAGFIYAANIGWIARSPFRLSSCRLCTGRPRCAQPKPRLMIFGREVLEGGMAALLGEAPVLGGPYL